MSSQVRTLILQSPADVQMFTWQTKLGCCATVLAYVAVCGYVLRHAYQYNLLASDVWPMLAVLGVSVIIACIAVGANVIRRKRMFAKWKADPPCIEHDVEAAQLVACWPGTLERTTIATSDAVAVVRATEPVRRAWHEQDATGQGEQLDEWFFFVQGEALARLPARSGQRPTIEAFLRDAGIGLGLSHCPKCGYAFGGVATQQCPECGTETPLDRAR